MATRLVQRLCGVLTSIALVAPANGAPPITVGEPFPDLVLPDLPPDGADGRPRTIAEFRGQRVVLHVFASW